MPDFQQKRRARRIIYSKVTIFVLLIIVILLTRSTYNVYKKERLIRESYLATAKNYEDLQSRKDNLESEIDRLGTEGGLEEEIREKFSVGKPGEVVVTVIDNTSSTDRRGNPEEKNLWQKFLDWFYK